MKTNTRAEQVLAATLAIDAEHDAPRSIAEYVGILRAAGHTGQEGELLSVADRAWRKAFRGNAKPRDSLLSGSATRALEAVMLQDAQAGRRRTRDEYLRLLLENGYAGSMSSASFIVSREEGRAFPKLVKKAHVGRRRRPETVVKEYAARSLAAGRRPTAKEFLEVLRAAGFTGSFEQAADVVRRHAGEVNPFQDAKAPTEPVTLPPVPEPAPQLPMKVAVPRRRRPIRDVPARSEAVEAVRRIFEKEQEVGQEPDHLQLIEAVDGAGYRTGILATRALIDDVAAKVRTNRDRAAVDQDWDTHLQSRILKDTEKGAPRPASEYVDWLMQEAGLDRRTARQMVAGALLG